MADPRFLYTLVLYLIVIAKPISYAPYCKASLTFVKHVGSLCASVDCGHLSTNMEPKLSLHS